jgi:hypothetical protein
MQCRKPSDTERPPCPPPKPPPRDRRAKEGNPLTILTGTAQGDYWALVQHPEPNGPIPERGLSAYTDGGFGRNSVVVKRPEEPSGLRLLDASVGLSDGFTPARWQRAGNRRRKC